VNGQAPPVAPDAAEHHEVQRLLPWHATHALPAGDAQRVEAHLVRCAACRAALAWELRVVDAQRDLLAPADAVERGFDAMKQRLSCAGPPGARLRGAWRDAPAWLRRVLALQTVAIVALTGLVIAFGLPDRGDDDAAVYRALGRGAPPATADVAVVFRADATEREIARVLAARGARIADGPTAGGAYLLALPPDARDAGSIARLRAEPAVVFAESLRDGDAEAAR